jgi:hypothetical protein
MSQAESTQLIVSFFQKSKAFQEKLLESLTQVKNFKDFSLNANHLKEVKTLKAVPYY